MHAAPGRRRGPAGLRAAAGPGGGQPSKRRHRAAGYGRPGCCSASSPTRCSATRGAGTRSPGSAPPRPRWSGAGTPTPGPGRGLHAARPGRRGGGARAWPWSGPVGRHPLIGVLGTAAADLGGARRCVAGRARRGAGRRADAGDLAAARARMPSLCGRDPALLDAAGMARAGIESMAENTSDAVVAPLLWGARRRGARVCSATARSTPWTRWSATGRRATGGSAGPPPGSTTWPTWCRPGSPRLLFAVLAPAVGGSPAAALRAWRRDAGGASQPQRRPGRGGRGRRARGDARRADRLPARRRAAAAARPRDRRRPRIDLRRAARLSRLAGAAAAVLAGAARPVRPGLARGRRPRSRRSSPASAADAGSVRLRRRRGAAAAPAGRSRPARTARSRRRSATAGRRRSW